LQLELAERAKAYPPDVRAVFERYDANNDSRLDYSELRIALTAYGLDVSDDKSRSYLNKYDRDKSGSMEIDEFARLVEELRRLGYQLKESELAALRLQGGQGRIPPDVRAAFSASRGKGGAATRPRSSAGLGGEAADRMGGEAADVCCTPTCATRCRRSASRPPAWRRRSRSSRGTMLLTLTLALTLTLTPNPNPTATPN